MKDIVTTLKMPEWELEVTGVSPKLPKMGNNFVITVNSDNADKDRLKFIKWLSNEYKNRSDGKHNKYQAERALVSFPEDSMLPVFLYDPVPVSIGEIHEKNYFEVKLLFDYILETEKK